MLLQSFALAGSVPCAGTRRRLPPLCGGQSNPLQCSLRSVTARPGHSLRALASQVGPGRGHLPCNPALVSRDGVRAPSGRGGWLAPNVRFLKLSLHLERRDAEAEAVPAACAACARLHWRSGPGTPSPRPSGSPAHCRALQSWRQCWGSSAAPPRGCRAGSGPRGPGRAGDHAVSPWAPPPAAPTSASASPRSQVRVGSAPRRPHSLPVPGSGRVADELRRLRRTVRALREPAEARAQVTEGPDPCAPRSSLNPPLFPWQQTEVS